MLLALRRRRRPQKVPDHVGIAPGEAANESDPRSAARIRCSRSLSRNRRCAGRISARPPTRTDASPAAPMTIADASSSSSRPIKPFSEIPRLPKPPRRQVRPAPSLADLALEPERERAAAERDSEDDRRSTASDLERRAAPHRVEPIVRERRVPARRSRGRPSEPRRLRGGDRGADEDAHERETGEAVVLHHHSAPRLSTAGASAEREPISALSRRRRAGLVQRAARS